VNFNVWTKLYKDGGVRELKLESIMQSNYRCAVKLYETLAFLSKVQEMYCCVNITVILDTGNRHEFLEPYLRD
jgi:hypothetical protein